MKIWTCDLISFENSSTITEVFTHENHDLKKIGQCSVRPSRTDFTSSLRSPCSAIEWSIGLNASTRMFLRPLLVVIVPLPPVVLLRHIIASLLPWSQGSTGIRWLSHPANGSRSARSTGALYYCYTPPTAVIIDKKKVIENKRFSIILISGYSRSE